LKGAEILLLPVMGEGEPRHWDTISRARAIDNGLYVVASMDQEWPSRIIDPRGEVVAETSDAFGIALAEIDLDRQDGVYWMSIGPGLGEPKSLYIRERRPETYGPLTR
jgi:predicted amidohydrolase